MHKISHPKRFCLWTYKCSNKIAPSFSAGSFILLLPHNLIHSNEKKIRAEKNVAWNKIGKVTALLRIQPVKQKKIKKKE